MGRLEGKKALVTGAGIGIGQSIAIELAREGATVAVHYAHSEQGAFETVASVESFGGTAVAVQADLSYVSQCFRIVSEVANQLGGLDILINNAGVTRALAFLDTDEAAYNEMLDVNMKSCFFCTQQAIQYFPPSGGSVVNVSSVMAFAGFPRHAAYAATKGAVVALTRALAIELAPRHVRVNAISPGIIEVPRYSQMPGYTTDFGNTLVPWGRVGRPIDIASAVVFLVSDVSEFITGQILYVDGGTTARLGLWWE